MKSKDEFYINRCLQLANNGVGFTRPNPSVGAVVVHSDKIIGEGFTSAYGGNHAEVNAIASVTNTELLKEATIYVTLEPCSHFGKTPPCADLIVQQKLKRVVIGALDTNPLVAGKGVARIEAAGIDVTTGVLEEECRQQHQRFFTVQNKKRPYIILKWAESKDGFIAPKTKDVREPIWISNTYSKQLVHKLRAREHAILVGTNTAIEDNPKLSVRTWGGNNPVRVVIDENLKTPKESFLFDSSVKTIFITNGIEIDVNNSENLVIEKINFNANIASQICEVLMKHNIQSIIIEGGAKTLQTFIDLNLWDEALVFTGDVNLKDGIKAPKLNAQTQSQEKIKSDILNIYRND